MNEMKQFGDGSRGFECVAVIAVSHMTFCMPPGMHACMHLYMHAGERSMQHPFCQRDHHMCRIHAMRADHAYAHMCVQRLVQDSTALGDI